MCHLEYLGARLLLPCILLAAWSNGGTAGTFHVPEQFPTIQAGIDASVTGDTVLVAPGVYSGAGNHDIFFRGRDIVVKSEGGAEATVVDANFEGNYGGFRFVADETQAAVLDGFTIMRVLGYIVSVAAKM